MQFDQIEGTHYFSDFPLFSVLLLSAFRMASPHIDYDILLKGFLEMPRIALVRRFRELCTINMLRLQNKLDAEEETFIRALCADGFPEAASGSENVRTGADSTTPPGAGPNLKQVAAKADRLLREHCTSFCVSRFL